MYLVGERSNLEDIKKNGPALIWDKQLFVSGNAVDLLLYLVKKYEPEPWDNSLREELLERLNKLKQ
jgi:hypothetical protein